MRILVALGSDTEHRKKEYSLLVCFEHTLFTLFKKKMKHIAQASI